MSYFEVSYLTPILLMVVCVELWIVVNKLDALVHVAKEGRK